MPLYLRAIDELKYNVRDSIELGHIDIIKEVLRNEN